MVFHIRVLAHNRALYSILSQDRPMHRQFQSLLYILPTIVLGQTMHTEFLQNSLLKNILDKQLRNA